MTNLTRLTTAVIIPTYNRADFLPETLASLLAQTRLPDEIIVVDDGSTDNTAELLARYTAPVIVIRQANQGRSAARNNGVRASTSDLIAFLDSDDTLVPDSIEKRAAFFAAHPSVDVLYTNVLMIDEKSRVLGTYTQVQPGVRPSGRIFAHFALDNTMQLQGFMLRRACLEAVGGFDVSMHVLEDYDLWLRLSPHYEFAYLDEPLATYRIHAAMTSVVQRQRMIDAKTELLERIRQMPAFEALPPADKARVYQAHGKIYAYMGRMETARRMLVLALRQCRSLKPVGLWGLTLFGRRVFSGILAIPSRLRGDLRIGI
jgi:glycosyltransferase involved in cell wall biosynthesis